MKKKDEIRKLKYELKIANCNLKLFQEYAHQESNIARDNIKLKLEIARLQSELIHAKGMLFNYETMLIAP